ncbi:Helix-turn-helix [Selenomonas ruminantium]|uniref:Helix-turn-helix n=1 Tax=Selenomonas ruminantium TaxID=971 RepID=A0A1M6WP79_SELRU|nr:helix-turn-helix transcriptional regulator [Selenomonas ruminantium]SHK95537.1 Helix-turn-helix [Selenomonas ruminantium]
MITGERIRNIREDKDILQQELADAVGINVSVLSRIEKGTRQLRDDELVKIADKLNASVDYLLGRTDEPQGTGFQKGLLGDINGDSPGGWQNMSLDDDDDSMDTESQKLLADYRQLDEKARETIKSMIEISLRKKANSDD